jgi:hypothetical protein
MKRGRLRKSLSSNSARDRNLKYVFLRIPRGLSGKGSRIEDDPPQSSLSLQTRR